MSASPLRLQLVFINSKSASKATVSIPLCPFLCLSRPSSSRESKVEFEVQQLSNPKDVSSSLAAEIKSTIDAFPPHALFHSVDGIQSLGIMVHESLN